MKKNLLISITLISLSIWIGLLALSIWIGAPYLSPTPSYGATNPFDRYEIASIVARTLGRVDLSKASAQDRRTLERLVIEFWDELDALGINAKDALISIADANGAISADAASRSAGTVPQWAYDAIAQLASRGVISGYPDASFSSNNLFGLLESLGSSEQPMPMMNAPSAQEPMRMGKASPAAQAPETARYGSYSDNPVKRVATDPVATFGLDVNTTSYSNVRRFLSGGRLPPVDAVRVEELINYFPPAEGDKKPDRLENSPFHVAYETAPCPWNEKKTILWLSVTARDLDYAEAPPANLVFLVDVSGSMNPPERLPLVKSALKMLVGNLRTSDNISLVTYSGSTAVVLPATPGSEKEKIIEAIDRLGAGGSTAGAAGLTLAYEQARKAFINGGVNRILLCTDGDFNVGVSDSNKLEKMVIKERESGITLSIFGFGTDNLNDEMMTRISSAGNGNYSYVDSMMEARKVLDEEMASTLVTVAKDVKAQIEFNPSNIAEYRQIGYEKRQLRNEDFSDDAIDAGDVGAGRRVTIIYELTPVGAENTQESRYWTPPSQDDKFGEIAYLKFRWKEPDGNKSSLAELPVLKSESASQFDAAGAGLRFSASVAAYGQKLRGNPNLGETDWARIESWADASRGTDPYRAEFLNLVKLAGSISAGK
ncbi:MAG: von Willebrand factor type A domain-containing protein [Synergistaceae bacterium]|jgi:Ca-activated chloride channel family protein|nr:von Willebrand factor type A domain-containing protein [Synergistaceae bacterium]